VSRAVIVVADDLGYDPAIDEGILEAHARGIVTAASALVDGPFAERALAAAPATLGIGLHLALPPGTPGAAARAGIDRQLRRFEEIRGAPPVHVDGHRHVHAEPAVLEAVLAAAAARGLRVRALDSAMRDRIRAAGATACDHFLGDADLRPCWTAGRLRDALLALPDGTTEIMTHPGRTPTHVRTSFGAEREIELAALCSAEVREALRASGANAVAALVR
jgi:hypothetical protein